MVVNLIQLIVKEVKGLKAVWQTAGNKMIYNFKQLSLPDVADCIV